MTRLLQELHRLYAPVPGPRAEVAAPAPALLSADDRVRALVFELAPADWSLLGRLWRGVQHDLDWPAPAIAVAGERGFQLWFSLEQAVPAHEAHGVLEALRGRYLADVAMDRIGLHPAVRPDGRCESTRDLPLPVSNEGNWSAFIAPDLAPLFVDTPWLDIEPGEEGQADLLRGMRSIPPVQWQAARDELQARCVPPASGTAATGAASTSSLAAPAASSGPDAGDAARRFLLRVLHDESVPLALRIEAATALLPFARPSSA